MGERVQHCVRLLRVVVVRDALRNTALLVSSWLILLHASFLFLCSVLYSTMLEAPALIAWFPVYYIFNGLLMVLQVLHVLWSCMIARIVLNAITGHGVRCRNL